jgi:RNA polymerase sigma-70 factor (ECF subfamily)
MGLGERVLCRGSCVSQGTSNAEKDSRLAGLMQSAQAGDSSAYQAVLRACVPIAAATARRSGVPADLVDDVVQDVLVTIHRALATYDPRRPFLPWLRAIAARRAIDVLRRTGRQGAREVHDEEAYLNHPEAGVDYVEDATRQADAGRLRAAISALPPRQREAMEILGLREQTLEQASHATGSSKVALKVNFFRALKSLRARLGSNADV